MFLLIYTKSQQSDFKLVLLEQVINKEIDLITFIYYKYCDFRIHMQTAIFHVLKNIYVVISMGLQQYIPLL